MVSAGKETVALMDRLGMRAGNFEHMNTEGRIEKWQALLNDKRQPGARGCPSAVWNIEQMNTEGRMLK